MFCVHCIRGIRYVREEIHVSRLVPNSLSILANGQNPIAYLQVVTRWVSHRKQAVDHIKTATKFKNDILMYLKIDALQLLQYYPNLCVR